MKIWIDALTGKHVRYACAIMKRMKELGHSFILTTREHPDTIPLARILNINFDVVGKYNVSSLSSRLRESLIRQKYFLKKFKEDKPDLLISHQSVDACRVAFGLEIPIILTADSPHADKVNKLTIPLTDTLITSSAIPLELYEVYNPRRIVTFKGVDELAWIKESEIRQDIYLKKDIIVRQAEIKSSYALNVEDITENIASRLASLGEVLFLHRYLKSYEGYVDTIQLIKQAKVVVSVGGTISREAALLGVPSIVLGQFENLINCKLYVDRFLSKKGFPLFFAHNSDEAVELVKSNLGKRFDVEKLIDGLENPLDIIEREAKRIESMVS